MNFRGNMQRNTNPMPTRPGPLMTDHLQDLELELELLKRKRQLIQRQQNDMLYNSAAAGNMRFDQPSQSFNDRFNEPRNLNFSHLYNEGTRDDRSFGVKRRAQADWPNAPVGPNPMGGNKRPRQGPSNRQNFQNNSQPFQKSQNFQKPRPNNQPQPLLGTPMPKPLMAFGPLGRRGPQPLMKQNQAPKPLTHHPNFKQNKPGPNRPNFISKKNASPKKPTPVTPNKNTTPKSAEKKQNTQTFMPDKQIDNKLNGRLELALGMVVKEIRATYGNKPEYRNLFNAMPLARLMKQGIRERVHSAMTGKVIGTANDILAEYRQKFPLETDKDIVELAVVEQQKNVKKNDLAIKLLEEGDPELYFKKNMQKLLQARFGDMMVKLEKMINDENKAASKAQILEHLPELKKKPEDITPAKQTARPAEETSVKAAEEVLNLDEETVKASEDIAKLDEDTAKVAEDTANVADNTAKVTEDAANNAEDTPKDPEDIAKVTEDTAIDAEDTAKVAEETVQVADEIPADLSSKAESYEKWLSFWIQRRLPSLLSYHRHTILKLFDLDHMYRNTKAAIIINANNKAQAMNISKVGYTSSDQGKDDPELPRNLPYFAKVLAIPAMPKRKIMQEFLNQFQPKTIKRHKKNYNLLFVGFDSKENYDKILAANQTTLGNATLSIVGNVAKTTTIELDGQNENDIDQVFTPQLDDQINDLLSSIRKADEESKGNDSTQVENIDLTEDISDEQETKVEEKSDANGNENPVANEIMEATDAEKSEVENDNEVEGNANDNGDKPDEECQVVEANGNNVVTIEDDEVVPLKSDDVKKGTPAKGRAPATPSSIRTRRSSRLVQN